MGNMPYLALSTTARHNHCTTGQPVWQESNYDLCNLTCQRQPGLQTFSIWVPMSRMNLSSQRAPPVTMSPPHLCPMKNTDKGGPKEVIAFIGPVMTVPTVCTCITTSFQSS